MPLNFQRFYARRACSDKGKKQAGGKRQKVAPEAEGQVDFPLESRRSLRPLPKKMKARIVRKNPIILQASTRSTVPPQSDVDSTYSILGRVILDFKGASLLIRTKITFSPLEILFFASFRFAV